jgi:hypothetical protein
VHGLTKIGLEFMNKNPPSLLLPPERMASLQQTLARVEQWELVAPCLLLVSSYRPCAFVIGQLLYVFAPLVTLFGLEGWQDWAALLSEPQGAAWLEEILAGDRMTRGQDDRMTG